MNVKSGKFVLNLGCGEQTYGDVRVDLYRCKANLLADVEKPLPLKDEVFDEVYSRFLFEHLKNPSNVLGEMVRVLKHGGKLVLVTDNAAFPPFHLPPIFGSGFHAGGYKSAGPKDKHYGAYTLEHIRNHLKEIGLQVVLIKYTYAEDVGGKGGAWQKFCKILKLHRCSLFRPFCMPNIVAVGIKPIKHHSIRRK